MKTTSKTTNRPDGRGAHSVPSGPASGLGANGALLLAGLLGVIVYTLLIALVRRILEGI